VQHPNTSEYGNIQQAEVLYNNERDAEPLYYPDKNPTTSQDFYRSTSLLNPGFQYPPRFGVYPNKTPVLGYGTDITSSITGRLGNVAISPPLQQSNGPDSTGLNLMPNSPNIPINYNYSGASNHYPVDQNAGRDEDIYGGDDANTSTTSAPPPYPQSPNRYTTSQPRPTQRKKI
jgi:hypothetical protein